MVSCSNEELELEDKEASVVHYRSHEETSVQHFVGLVFRHRQYRYNGCIFGWDVSTRVAADSLTSR
jgi:F-box protein 21